MGPWSAELAGEGAIQPYLPLATHGYREFPTQVLGVETLYAFSSVEGAQPTAVPDGCVDLAFGIGESDLVVTIGGTVLKAKEWPFSPRRTWVGCRFYPGEAPLPAGVIPSDLVDADLDLPPDAYGGRLEEALGAASDTRARLDALTDCLVSLGPPQVSASLRKLERAGRQAIVRDGGTKPVAAVAEELGVSERQLRRAFADVEGVSPKQFARFVRFQRALALIKAKEEGATVGVAGGLASACGYYDQAHLVHEFRSFAGMSPGAFRELVSGEGTTLRKG